VVFVQLLVEIGDCPLQVIEAALVSVARRLFAVLVVAVGQGAELGEAT
jgi:hypothetical protein